MDMQSHSSPGILGSLSALSLPSGGHCSKIPSTISDEQGERVELRVGPGLSWERRYSIHVQICTRTALLPGAYPTASMPFPRVQAVDRCATAVLLVRMRRSGCCESNTLLGSRSSSSPDRTMPHMDGAPFSTECSPKVRGDSQHDIKSYFWKYKRGRKNGKKNVMWLFIP